MGLGLWLKTELAQHPKNLVELSVRDLQMRHVLYLYYKNNIVNEEILDFIDFLSSKDF